MNILITGPTGFIGERLVRTLAAHRLVLAVRTPAAVAWAPDGSRIVAVDELDAGMLKGIDVVLHFAGRAHRMNEDVPDPLEEYRRVNRDLALRLAAMSLAAGVKKFVYASTVKVMGEGGRGVTAPLSEKEMMAPRCPYGKSKMEAEEGLAKLFSGQSAAALVILRIPMVYGPGNKGNMLSLLNMAARKIPLPLGDMKAKRSFLYVGNLCDAVRTIVESDGPARPEARAYFVTDGADLSSAELYAIISREYSGKNGVYYFPLPLLSGVAALFGLFERLFRTRLPLNGETLSKLADGYRFSPEAFCADYRWHPPYSPADGIRAAVQWHKGVPADIGKR